MPKSSFSVVCRSAWHSSFLALLPQIRNYVVPAFRHLRQADRDDAIQNAIAHAFVMFVSLRKRNRADHVFPTVLARFGIGHTREGRSFGTPMNSLDVTSKSAQLLGGFSTTQLDRCDWKKRRWLEAVVEDHRTDVADQAAFRIDFPDWLSRLTARNRRIAESLAYGNSTNAVARQFRVSAARIAQIRGELHDSWHGFHGGLALVDARCPHRDRQSSRNRYSSPTNSARQHRNPNRISAAALSGDRVSRSTRRFSASRTAARFSGRRNFEAQVLGGGDSKAAG
jgi:hypothetical protein